MTTDDTSSSPQDIFIPVSEALALVREAGFSDSTFYRWASPAERRITKRLAQGRQRGAEYSKADILRLVRKREVPAHGTVRGPQGATDWIKRTDLPFVQSLDLDLYGPDNIVDMAITVRWWEKNPHMCRVLFNAQDRRDIWGAISVLPMREETIFRLVRQELSERDISLDDIYLYEPGHSYTGYVASVVIRPQYRAHLRSLIQSVLEFWCSLYPSIKVSRLYGFALSEDGLRLIRHLFFSPRYDLGDSAFELDLYRPGNPSPLVQQFQRCIEQRRSDAAER
jgi:hypothetical protein